jgi:F0F1-type ATP synthase epsilon subunit
MKHPAATSLNVTARSPFKVHYEGPAKSVSAANQVGQFDVLPGHADFFSMLTGGQVIIETEKDSLSIPVSNGIISVRGDEVLLFLNM